LDQVETQGYQAGDYLCRYSHWEDGSYIAAPEAYIVGHGLEAVNKAFEVSKKGVRAKKVVVSLAES